MALSLARLVVQLSVLLACLMIKDVCCDYSCLCSYQVELEIFEKPDPTSTVDGYMYEFDCKPAYRVDGLDPTYRAIGNEGKLGYILMTTNIQVQTCQGSIPDIDRVITTSTAAVPTTTTTEKTEATTTLLQTTTTTLPSTKVTTIPTTTTTVKPTLLTITIRQNATKMTTSQTTLRTTTPIKTTTTHIKTTKPAFTMPPATTNGISTTCPSAVSQRSKPQYISQYGNICYEYVPSKDSWRKAQIYCNNSGGHLVSIENEAQQMFVSNMLSQIPITTPIWLGLHDRVNEEQWQLDTGIPATYTNWAPGRYIDQYHDQEDCGLLVPFRKHEWDDVECNGITYGNILISHPWICQYT